MPKILIYRALLIAGLLLGLSMWVPKNFADTPATKSLGLSETPLNRYVVVASSNPEGMENDNFRIVSGLVATTGYLFVNGNPIAFEPGNMISIQPINSFLSTGDNVVELRADDGQSLFGKVGIQTKESKGTFVDKLFFKSKADQGSAHVKFPYRDAFPKCDQLESVAGGESAMTKEIRSFMDKLNQAMLSHDGHAAADILTWGEKRWQEQVYGIEYTKEAYQDDVAELGNSENVMEKQPDKYNVVFGKTIAFVTRSGAVADGNTNLYSISYTRKKKTVLMRGLKLIRVDGTWRCWGYD